MQLQLKGTKQVLMFEPHDNAKLYEAHIPQATLSYNKHTKAFRRAKLEDSTSMVMSPVDILKPEFEVCTLDDNLFFFFFGVW